MNKKDSLVHFSLCIAGLAVIAVAQDNARFLMTDYEIFEGDFLGMRNDTVYMRVPDDDGKKVRKSFHKSRFKGVMLPGGDILDLSLSAFAVETAAIDGKAEDAVAEGPVAKTSADTATADTTATSAEPAPQASAEPPEDDPEAEDTAKVAAEAADSSEGDEEVAETAPGEQARLDSTGSTADDTSVTEDTAIVDEGGEDSVSTARAAAPTDAPADSAAPSALSIASTPPGGTVYIDWEPVEGATPVTVSDLAPGKRIVRVAKDTLVAAANAMLAPGKELKLDLQLGPPVTELEIASTPREARVYIGGPRPRKRREPDYLTPAIHQGIEKTSLKFHMAKEGYRDTTVEVMVVPGLTNAVSVKLVPVAPGEAATASRRTRTLRQRKVGLAFSIPSIACVATSGILFALAARDHADARDAKEFVEGSLVASTEVEEKIRENENAVSSGNAKLGAAFGFLAAGGAGLTAGLVLRF